MDLDTLYLLVTEAIRRAEVLTDLRAPGAPAAHMDVSLLEERIADLVPALDPEGAIARRGAVRAAAAAGDASRARALATRYGAEAGAGSDLARELDRLAGPKQREAEMRSCLVVMRASRESNWIYEHAITPAAEIAGLRLSRVASHADIGGASVVVADLADLFALGVAIGSGTETVVLHARARAKLPLEVERTRELPFVHLLAYSPSERALRGLATRLARVLATIPPPGASGLIARLVKRRAIPAPSVARRGSPDVGLRDAAVVATKGSGTLGVMEPVSPKGHYKDRPRLPNAARYVPRS